MPLNIDQLDDEPVIEHSPAAPVVVNSYSPVNELPPTDYAILVNCDTSIEGRIATRRGTMDAATTLTNPILGVGYYSTDQAAPPTYPNCLVAVVNVAGTGIFKAWDGSWHTVATYVGGATNRVRMAQGQNRLFVAQEGTVLYAFNGSTIGVIPATGVPNTEPPVKPKYVCWHTDRVITAGILNQPNTLSMSQYLDGNVWDHTNWDMDIGSGDGDPIVGIVPWTNFNLVVLKQHSVWIVNCNPALVATGTGNISGFQVTRVHNQIGCLNGDSAVQVGADVFFLSDSGIRGVARTFASEQQNVVGAPLSEPITDIINRINPAALGTMVGFYWRNRYILSVALDSATTPSHLIIWNSLTNGWSGYWTGLSVTCFTSRIFSGSMRMALGQTNGLISDFMDYVTVANEVDRTYQDSPDSVPVNYATSIVSRGFTCGVEESLKTGLFASLLFEESKATADVSFILNGNEEIAAQSFSTDAASVSLPIDLPFELTTAGIYPKSIDLQQYGQWLHLQVKIASTAGKLSTNRVGIGAFMDTYLIQG